MDRFKGLAPLMPALGIALVALGIAAPHLAHAVTGTLSPGFRIIPDACNCISGAGWGCVIAVVQNLFQFVIFLGVLLCVIGAVWGGFELVINPLSPANREKGKTMLIDAAIGLVIVLAAYLLVNTLLTVLTKKNLSQETSFFSSSGGPCLPEAIDQAGNPISYSGTATTGSVSVPLQNGSGACNSLAVQNGASAGLQDISSTQAQLLACFANAESACGAAVNTSQPNYKWGQGSSAAGAFQVTLQGNSSCYDNLACESAVGVSTPLNCASGFSGGNPIPNSPVVSKCLAAAANLNCSAAAAACVLKKQGPSAWTADSNNAKQQACVNTYGA